MNVQVDEIANTVEIVSRDTTVEVQQISYQVVITAPGPQGIQGPPGVSGQADLGGYPAVIVSPSRSDLLQFSAQNTWVNSPLVDGGNF